MLNTLIHGEDTSQPPLLIAHGLFGSARNWGVLAKRLSDTRRVLAVDMRNHGASPWEDSHTYPDLAADLAEVIAAHGGVADVVGHSMGGKAAMALALGHPRTVRRLVVADIAPVAYGHTQQPMIDAMRAVDLARWRGAGMPMRSLRRWCRRTGCARSFCNRLTWAGSAGA
jgi:esterase